MKTLSAFHGKKKEKEFYVNRLIHHRKLEHLTQGVGWETGAETKACAIGCLLEEYNHTLGPDQLGLPEWLLRLCDFLFEKLPAKDANKFAIDWVKAIPEGANVEPVKHQLAIWRIDLSLKRLAGNKEPYAIECRNALNLVRAWHISGGVESAESASAAAWSAARSAWSAAESAAWSAAEWSAARSSARSAAESAESSASAYIKSEAKTLIKLLKSSKP